MRVLVTGATGFIGRGTLDPLLDAGYEVHPVSRGKPDDPAARGLRWEQADLLDPRGADVLLARVAPSHLLHLAWYAEPGAFWDSSENLRWVEASLRLLRAFAENGGRRAVFAGTCAEYAWTERVVCSELTTPCHPATLYGASKHALHLIADRFAEGTGISLAWGRVFFVFGPGEDPTRLAGSIARSLVRGEPALLSHGNQVRDFLYSEDLAEALVALLSSHVEGAVNLASGIPASIRDLAEALGAAAGRAELLNFGAREAPAGEPAQLVADVRVLREEVGWTPRASLQARAADTIAWWRTALTNGGRRREPA
jgi:nucleoside-diphosphate-sugar epimerase